MNKKKRATEAEQPEVTEQESAEPEVIKEVEVEPQPESKPVVDKPHGFVKYVCKTPGFSIFTRHSQKKFDTRKGVVNDKRSRLTGFIPFNNVKMCYLVVDTSTDDGKEIQAAIESCTAFKSGAITKHAANYYPPGELIAARIEKRGAQLESKPKSAYQKFFKESGMWECAFCGWMCPRDSIGALLTHLQLEHGVKADEIPSKDGDEIKAHSGAFRGKTVKVYRSREQLDMVAAQEAGIKEPVGFAKVGQVISVTREIGGVVDDVVGKLIEKHPQYIVVMTENGTINAIKRETIVGRVKIVNAKVEHVENLTK